MSEECQQKARKDVSIKDIPSIGTDPLRYCLNNKLVDQDGLWLEFGVHEGQTIDLISRFTKNDVYGFDTFSGLDAPWLGTETKSMLVFDIGGKPPKTVRPLHPTLRGCRSKKRRAFNDNVQFVTGLFEETLGEFLELHDKKISFIHVDCDIYRSTKTILDYCTGFIKEGCIIVFDELVNYKSYHEHEIKAFKEFVLENNVTFEWIGSTSDIMHSDQIEQAYIKLQGKPQRRVCHDRSVACKILSMS